VSKKEKWTMEDGDVQVQLEEKKRRRWGGSYQHLLAPRLCVRKKKVARKTPRGGRPLSSSAKGPWRQKALSRSLETSGWGGRGKQRDSVITK